MTPVGTSAAGMAEATLISSAIFQSNQHGSIEDDADEGIYKLKMYTSWCVAHTHVKQANSRGMWGILLYRKIRKILSEIESKSN